MRLKLGLLAVLTCAALAAKLVFPLNSVRIQNNTTSIMTIESFHPAGWGMWEIKISESSYTVKPGDAFIARYRLSGEPGSFFLFYDIGNEDNCFVEFGYEGAKVGGRTEATLMELYQKSQCGKARPFKP